MMLRLVTSNSFLICCFEKSVFKRCTYNFRYMELMTHANKIETACFDVIREGKILTGDLGGKGKCSEFTDAICKKIESS